MSKNDEDAIREEMATIRNLYDSIELLGTTTVAAKDMIVLGKKYACLKLDGLTHQVLAWLDGFKRAMY